MNDDATVLRLLTQVLDEAPRSAPTGLLESVIHRVDRAPQRRRWMARRPRLAVTPPSRTRWLAAAVVIALVGGLAFIQLAPHQQRPAIVAPPSPSGATSPTPSPSGRSRSAQPSTWRDGAVALEDLRGTGQLATGTTYTSRDFSPAVTFRLGTREGGRGEVGGETDFCPTVNHSTRLEATGRMIALFHPKSCRDAVTIYRADAFDCGVKTARRDAESAAVAILANPGLAGARDLGSLEEGGVPSDLFAHPYPGRVIDIAPSRSFDPGSADPDHCRLTAGPDDGPSIAIRGDLAARLALLDVNGELVVVEATGPLAGHMLDRIFDIDFGPGIAMASKPPRQAPLLPPGFPAERPPEIVIPAGVHSSQTAQQVMSRALHEIAANERALGYAIVPARIVRVQLLAPGESYPLDRFDGTNAHGGALGPSEGPGWAVEAVGTFIHISRTTGKLDGKGMHGFFEWDDAGGSGGGYIPCWNIPFVAVGELEGSCR
jgi:hypothetical protein